MELRELEPEVTTEVKAAQTLLMHHPGDVPSQLLIALEKDQKNLTRAYQAAKTLSGDMLQNLRDRRDSYKVQEKK